MRLGVTEYIDPAHHLKQLTATGSAHLRDSLAFLDDTRQYESYSIRTADKEIVV